MKLNFTLVLALVTAAFTSMAQNQITTPSGQPLVIGNQGIKHATLNSGSAAASSNGKVLSLDANGLFILVNDAMGGGTPSPWMTTGSKLYYNSDNVGLGVTDPLQRLDVNGNVNIASGSGLRIGNVPFLRAPGLANSILGANAGTNLTTGSYNVLIGQEAGFGNSGNNTGAGNVFLGYRAGYNNTSGGNNFYMGNSAGFSSTTGIYNVMIGTSAGQYSTGSYNTALGYSAGQYSTGTYNFFLGHESGKGSSGAPNIGSANVFIGYRTGYVNIGSNNIFFGNQTGLNNTSGYRNVFIGTTAGNTNTTGYENTAIGHNASLGSSGLTGSTVIGANASVSQSNSVILGNSGALIGIGNTAPTAKLHVTAGGTTATGVRFEGLPNATGTTYKLYVDDSGNIMKASAAGAREDVSSMTGTQWILTENNNLVNNNPGSVLIGTGLTTTPNGYKLYVSDGILTERVKVAVKSTADWRDNVLQEDYSLRSVQEVESFIKANHHLPGVPSAQEMVEQGNDLQKTDAILLEKIEEMMLYIIELKKENTTLKGQIEQIQQKISNSK